MNATNFYKHSLIISLFALLLVTVSLPRILGFAPIVIAFVSLITYRIVFKIWPYFSKYAFGWAFVFAGLAILSSLWAVNPEISIERGSKLIILLTSGALLISMVLSLDQTARLFFQKVFPWIVVIMGILLTFELYLQAPIYHIFHSFSVEDPFNLSKLNRGIAIFMLSVFVTLPLVYKQKQRPDRLWLLAALLISTLAIIYKTESQAAHLCFVVGVIFFFFPYHIKTAWYALMGLFVICMISAPWIAQGLFNTFPEMIGEHEWLHHSYADRRMEIWDFVARRALENPLLGFGVEATKAMKDFDTARIYHPTTQILHPHNFVLQIWIEFGILGILLSNSFFIWIFFNISKLSSKNARQCLPAFMACITLAVVTYGLWQGWWIGSFILLIVFCILSLDKTSDKS
ncbi:MAG: O-antigen ligase family protein [Alphaproteobacteria bacterium]|nr:O-antigen ligase family protein [Alphaproteobacteria bacterium]